MNTTEMDVEIEIACQAAAEDAAKDIATDLERFAPAEGDPKRAGWLAALEFIRTNYSS